MEEKLTVNQICDFKKIEIYRKTGYRKRLIVILIYLEKMFDSVNREMFFDYLERIKFQKSTSIIRNIY